MWGEKAQHAPGLYCASPSMSKFGPFSKEWKDETVATDKGEQESVTSWPQQTVPSGWQPPELVGKKGKVSSKSCPPPLSKGMQEELVKAAFKLGMKKGKGLRDTVAGSVYETQYPPENKKQGKGAIEGEKDKTSPAVYQPSKKGAFCSEQEQYDFAKGKGVQVGKQSPPKGISQFKGECLPPFEQKGRDAICRLLVEAPDDLRSFIAFNILKMPSAGPSEVSRMLFQRYGALATETCHLFRCMNIGWVIQKVWGKYRLPPKGVPTAEYSEEEILLGGEADIHTGEQGSSARVGPSGVVQYDLSEDRRFSDLGARELTPPKRTDGTPPGKGGRLIPVCVSTGAQTDPWTERWK